MYHVVSFVALVLAGSVAAFSVREAGGREAPSFSDIRARWEALEQSPRTGEWKSIGEGSGSKRVAGGKHEVVTKIGESGFVLAGTSHGVETVRGKNDDYRFELSRKSDGPYRLNRLLLESEVAEARKHDPSLYSEWELVGSRLKRHPALDFFLGVPWTVLSRSTGFSVEGIRPVGSGSTECFEIRFSCSPSMAEHDRQHDPIPQIRHGVLKIAPASDGFLPLEYSFDVKFVGDETFSQIHIRNVLTTGPTAVPLLQERVMRRTIEGATDTQTWTYNYETLHPVSKRQLYLTAFGLPEPPTVSRRRSRHSLWIGVGIGGVLLVVAGVVIRRWTGRE